MDQAFMRDAVELATERVARGELDRRTFLRGLALLGLGAAVAPGPRRGAEAEGDRAGELGRRRPQAFL